MAGFCRYRKMALHLRCNADDRAGTSIDWDMVKSTTPASLLIWALNTLLLAVLASRWWLGVIAGVMMALLATFMRSKVDPKTLRALVCGVVPAWRNNVQLARAQTQEAIDMLTLRFASIHQRIGGNLSAAQGSKKSDLGQVVQDAAVQLGGIATVLEQVLATRDVLLSKMAALNQPNDEIGQLAQDMERTADSARLILSKSAAIRMQIQAASLCAEQFDADAGRMMDNARKVIDAVIADFRASALQLSSTVVQLEGENRAVDQEVCDILVNLQFQDRINQILDQVQHDMRKLEQLTEQRSAVPTPTAWLAALEQSYTTPEQRQHHTGQQAARTMHSQVDFF